MSNRVKAGGLLCKILQLLVERFEFTLQQFAMAGVRAGFHLLQDSFARENKIFPLPLPCRLSRS